MKTGLYEMNCKNWKGKNPELKTKSRIPSFAFITFCFLASLFCLFITSAAATENQIHISSDYLEYNPETREYSARGSVKIVYEDSTLTADEVHLNSLTTDVIATGNVIYEDLDTLIKAKKLELNLKTKLGTLYSSNILYRKSNYRIHGGDLKRLGRENYSMDRATATTCDDPIPAWRFTSKDIQITLQKNITAKNATFYIKNIPVLYSPYFWVPLTRKRETGLLLPVLGYSNTKGFIFKQGFFWALKDNMDATVYIDYYSQKGVAEGIDYRYILSPETSGELWMYHLKDNDRAKDFFELKSYHNQKLPYNMSGYLKLHIVNEFDYYNVLDSTSFGRIGLSSWESDPFGFASEERLQKYLESNLHISKPFHNGRVYLLGQYRQSIEDPSESIPQSLPEVGIAINTRNIWIASFSLEAAGTNFINNEAQYGQRLDLYPNIYLSLGRKINFTQKIGLRETLYSLKNPAKNTTREIFNLNSILTTRLIKSYPSLTHIVEPSIEYIYTPDVDQSSLPLFDSTDSMPEINILFYSLTNRFAGQVLNGMETRLRFSQSYSFLDRENPFSPILIESSFSSRNLNLSTNATYNVYDNNITETITSVTLSGKKGFINFGKNFRRSTFLDQYTTEAGLNRPIKILGMSIPANISGTVWYDLKGGGVQESRFQSTYTKQCWGFTFSYNRKPHEYRIFLGIEFKGLGSIKLGYL